MTQLAKKECMLFKCMFLCMEKSRFGLLDDQELRFLDSLVVHNSLSSKTWLGLMLGMKVTENQCSCKDVVSNGYLETSFCFLNIFLLKGLIIQALFWIYFSQMNHFHSRFRAYVPRSLGMFAAQRLNLAFYGLKSSRYLSYFSRFSSAICSY